MSSRDEPTAEQELRRRLRHEPIVADEALIHSVILLGQRRYAQFVRIAADEVAFIIGQHVAVVVPRQLPYRTAADFARELQRLADFDHLVGRTYLGRQRSWKGDKRLSMITTFSTVGTNLLSLFRTSSTHR